VVRVLDWQGRQWLRSGGKKNGRRRPGFLFRVWLAMAGWVIRHWGRASDWGI